MENMTLTENQVTKKSKLMTWIATILLGGAIAFGAFLSTLSSKTLKTSAYSIDDETYTIVLSVDEMSNYSFDNLQSFVNSNTNKSDWGIISYDSYTERSFRLSSGNLYGLYAEIGTGVSLRFGYYNSNSQLGHFYVRNSQVGSENAPSSDLTWVVNSSLYEGVLSAIQEDLPSPSSPVNPQDWLTEIISLLTGGIVGISSGIGTGVSSLVGDIFINNGALSIFGATIIIFAGVSLAIGLCRWVMNFLTSLGAKK